MKVGVEALCLCACTYGEHVRHGHSWLCFGKPKSPEKACTCDACKDAVEEGAEPYCRCRRFRPAPPAPAEAST